MVDRSIIRSLGRWEGEIEAGDVCKRGSFEVFDSKGSWDLLFGKTLLKAFKGVHNYNTDEVTLKGSSRCTTLKNQIKVMEDERQENQ